MRWVVNATPRPLYPRERPGTHCIRGWVGPRPRLDGCGKSRPLPGFDPRTVQPVPSRYTDCAILTHTLTVKNEYGYTCTFPLCLHAILRGDLYLFLTDAVNLKLWKDSTTDNACR